jgi:predicted RNase H-like HicB family nuclease
MKESARYLKIIEWSEEDQCFIGSCPELFYGGCHGDNEREVFDELCKIVENTLELYRRDGRPLPMPISGKDLVNILQKVA